jgi:hypothetical protein
VAMITLRYPPSPYFVVAVWIDDLPGAADQAETVVGRDVSAPSGISLLAMRAAAEHSRITGPRGYYGLLGATFTPDHSRQLRLRVVTSGDDGPVYTGPSVRPRWAGQVGLPREYTEAILTGAVLALEKDTLGGDDLRFDRAVHHRVDSNAYIYHRLAMLVTRLLQLDAASLSEEALSVLAEKYLRR